MKAHAPPDPTVRLVDESRRSESDLPQGCSLREVEEIFGELLAGANSGDRSRVLRRIAPQPELSPFILGRDSRSPTGDSGQEFHTPDAIYRYFAEQSRRGYRRFLRRAWVQPINPHSDRGAGPLRRPASGPAADDPVVAVGFDITVTDKQGTDIDLAGKGAINCETGRFYMYVGG